MLARMFLSGRDWRLLLPQVIVSGIDSRLAARGWKRVPENGEIHVAAHVTRVKGQTFNNFYSGIGHDLNWLGIHLDAWQGRIIETKKGVVRLIPVVERARQLFGEAGAEALASSIERSPANAAQLELFPDSETKVAKIKPKGRKKRKRGKRPNRGHFDGFRRVNCRRRLRDVLPAVNEQAAPPSEFESLRLEPA